MRQFLLVLVLAFAAPSFAQTCGGGPLDHDQKRLLGGNENPCSQYGGKVILVVNTASHCGYTPQFEGIEKLYKSYKDKGFVVLGFPSGDFHQEESTDESIAKFCSANYGVSFPMYSKTAVTGTDANILYKGLKTATGHQPTWNFNKYVIGRDGKVLAYFPSDVEPQNPKITQIIEAELAKPAPVSLRPASTQ